MLSSLRKIVPLSDKVSKQLGALKKLCSDTSESFATQFPSLLQT